MSRRVEKCPEKAPGGEASSRGSAGRWFYPSMSGGIRLQQVTTALE